MSLETRKDHLQIYNYAMKALDLADRRIFHMTDHGPGHIERSLYFAELLSLVYGLDENEKRLLSAGCYLHDIGLVKGRENHAENGAQIIEDAIKEKLLDFDSGFTELVLELIRRHSGPMESELAKKYKKYKGSVNLDLIISLLRIADALDMDCRRAADYNDPIFRQMFKFTEPESELHHFSLGGIAALRLYLHHIPAIEIFVTKPKEASLQISRLQREIAETSLTIPTMLIPVHEEKSGIRNQEKLRSGKIENALIVSYCNPMGVINAGITKSSLLKQGSKSDVLCGWKTTNDLVKFLGGEYFR